MRKLVFLIAFIALSFTQVKAQKDSVKVAERLNSLMDVCRKIDFSDPNIMKLGIYYKAADFFIYKGVDGNRNLKSAIDYAIKSEKAYVDEHCKSVNALLSKNSDCVLGAFKSEEKMEGKTYFIDLKYRDNPYEAYDFKTFSYIKVGVEMYLLDISE